VIVHENPRVAEVALDAAKFRLQQADLVAEGDLNLAYTTWQLADMWQFGYLSRQTRFCDAGAQSQ